MKRHTHRATSTVAIAVGLLLAAAAQAQDAAPLSDEQLITAAKGRVAHEMKDPGSVQFRDVTITTSGTSLYVCGEYNAKNSYGAYVGFRKFFDTGESAMTEGEVAAAADLFRQLWQHICAPKA